MPPAAKDFDESQPPYLDIRLSVEQRVQDLVKRLTLPEKISQMCNAAPAIPRLGMAAYDFWSEALHGVARNGRATVFPQAIGLATTWDSDLVQQIASAIADEGRAKHHEAMRRAGDAGQYQGLTFWSPNINIFRDPRWGRGQETYGEDPYLTGEIGAAFVRGLQGDHPRYLKVAACAKHFAVHSGPEKSRHSFDAHVSPQDLFGTYLPAFKKLVTEARVEAVMGAYNRVNGEPACASPTLLLDILRGQWGFTGHVVSDCGAINDIHQGHALTRDSAESAALAVRNGCDMSCVCTYASLDEAVQRGLITEAEIDLALERTLATRFRLGMFDPPEEVPFTAIPMSVVNSPAHRELAYQAAQKAVVLLKNKDDVLPIRPETRSLLIVGPNAASVDALLGNYYGISDTLSTTVEGIAGRAPEGMRLGYRAGCHLTTASRNRLDWGLVEAGAADLTIACMGLAPLLEGEEGDANLSAESGDRTDLGLPAVQVEYLKNLAYHGAKIILVLFGGGPVALGELEDLVAAILWVGYPGQEGGRALASILFGDVSPSGKLPVTFPKSVSQLPPFEDYAMRGRTYRYADWESLFPFGFGLSYTRFEYLQLELAEDRIAGGQALNFQVSLKNNGSVAAEEVVQVYLTHLTAPFEVPRHSLVAFQRILLGAGEQQEVSFRLPAEALLQVDEQGQSRFIPGRFRLTVGGCSPSPRGAALGAPQPLTAEFEV